jgi:hypothetical protein
MRGKLSIALNILTDEKRIPKKVGISGKMTVSADSLKVL